MLRGYSYGLASMPTHPFCIKNNNVMNAAEILQEKDVLPKKLLSLYYCTKLNNTIHMNIAANYQNHLNVKHSCLNKMVKKAWSVLLASNISNIFWIKVTKSSLLYPTKRPFLVNANPAGIYLLRRKIMKGDGPATRRKCSSNSSRFSSSPSPLPPLPHNSRFQRRAQGEVWGPTRESLEDAEAEQEGQREPQHPGRP
jgi:hypothetical protein